MPRFTRRELVALAGTTLLGAAVVVTAAVGQMRAAVSLIGVLLVILSALVVRNNRALVRNRRALDWLSRPAPVSPAEPADSLPEVFEQMRADLDSSLKGLQRDLETVRFGQTTVSQTAGRMARDVADLAERHEALETMIASMRGTGPTGAPATRDDLPRL